MFVSFREGTNNIEQREILAAKYDFIPVRVEDPAFPGFTATLTPAQVASLRCEPTVLRIGFYENAIN